MTPPHPPAPMPDVTVAIDRLVLEDPGLDPGRARRLQDAVELRAIRLLQDGSWPTGPSRPQALPDPGDDRLADELARAIADAVHRQGGPYGHA